MTEPEDVKKGLAAIQITNNLEAINRKLEQERKKASPDPDRIKKFNFQLSCCRKGLLRKT